MSGWSPDHWRIYDKGFEHGWHAASAWARLWFGTTIVLLAAFVWSVSS